MVDHTLTVQNLTKVFQTSHGEVCAVNDVSFELAGDTFFTMLGPSGCGKTTTLRMIAGLESITTGTINFDGRNFIHVMPSRRNIGMVFQSYALFPHMTVFENVAYGLRVRKASPDTIKWRVSEVLSLVGLSELAHRYPSDLSGGQQQRVSIARALVYEPSLLLLDEPLANLDAKLRIEMREEIRRIQKELGIMTIYVTHDQEEAMSVSDRLAVFNAGRLIQLGAPDEIYNEPKSVFVSQFIGKANLFKGRVVRRDRKTAKVALEGGVEVTGNAVVDTNPDFPTWVSEADGAIMMIRPEHTSITSSGDGLIPVRITRIQFLGNFFRYIVECRNAVREVIVDTPRAIAGLAEGDAANLILNADDIRVFVGDESASS